LLNPKTRILRTSNPKAREPIHLKEFGAKISENVQIKISSDLENKHKKQTSKTSIDKLLMLKS